MTWAEAIGAELRSMGHHDYSSCDLPGCWHSDDPVLTDAAMRVWRRHAMRPPADWKVPGLRSVQRLEFLGRSGITGKKRWAGLVR